MVLGYDPPESNPKRFPLDIYLHSSAKLAALHAMILERLTGERSRAVRLGFCWQVRRFDTSGKEVRQQ